MCDPGTIRNLVGRAIGDLFRSDKDLFETDAAEPAISHRFAVHLQVYFPTWDVDCEYNRNQETIKRVSYEKLGHYGLWNVVPDIIVHRRRTNQNLLVIEIKKSTNPEPDDGDMRKIEAYHSQLGYVAAAFFRFLSGQQKLNVQTEHWESDA